MFNYGTRRVEEVIQPSKFKLGDVVTLILDIPAPNGGHYGPIKKGAKGYITRVASTGRVGVSFYNYYEGHDCNQSAPNGTGLYIEPRYLKGAPKTIEDDFAELARMCE